jgi:hypothetical protein
MPDRNALDETYSVQIALQNNRAMVDSLPKAIVGLQVNTKLRKNRDHPIDGG